MFDFGVVQCCIFLNLNYFSGFSGLLGHNRRPPKYTLSINVVAHIPTVLLSATPCRRLYRRVVGCLNLCRNLNARNGHDHVHNWHQTLKIGPKTAKTTSDCEFHVKY